MNKGCSHPIIFNQFVIDTINAVIQITRLPSCLCDPFIGANWKNKFSCASFVFFLPDSWKKYLSLQCIWIFVVKFIDDFLTYVHGSKIKTWAVITQYQQVGLSQYFLLVFTKSVESNFCAFWLAPVTRNILGYSLFCERRRKIVLRFAKVSEEEIEEAFFLSIWSQLFKRWLALSSG